MPDHREWRTVVTRANSTSVSLRTTVPHPVLVALGITNGNAVTWRVATISGSVCAVVGGEP